MVFGRAQIGIAAFGNHPVNRATLARSVVQSDDNTSDILRHVVLVVAVVPEQDSSVIGQDSILGER